MTSILVVLVIVLASVILHELAHGYVAYLLGDDTAKNDGRLTLNPLAHIDPMLSVVLPLLLFITGGPVFGGAKPVPVNPRKLKYGAWGMALVAIAGPLMNFILALAGFLIGYFTGAFSLSAYGSFYNDVMMNFVFINLGFMVFNLIPIPPLDGSRVLYAIAPDQVRGVLDKVEGMGILIVLLIVIVFPSLLSGIMGNAMNGIWDAFCWIVGVR